MEFWRDQISQGQAPLWNPYIFAGVPQLANPMTNTLSPLNFWFFLFNDVYRGLAVLVVVLIPFAAVGMYLFLKELRLPTLAAFLGGVLFAFSGTTLSNINDLNSLQAVVFIPWVLWLSQRYIVANNRVKLGIVLAFVLALQFVSGHPQYCYYTWLLLTGNLLIFGRQRLRQKLISIVLIFGLTVMLIAVELVPFVELTQLIHRPDSDQFANTNAIEIYDLPQFLLGHFYGSWQNGNSWGFSAPLETGRAHSRGFLGIVALILALVQIIKQRNKVVVFWIGVALLSLVLSLGSVTPLYVLVRNVLPLFDRFRSPARILTIYTFSVSILSAYGFEYVRSKYIYTRKN